jgi:hypothetical protein
MRNRKKGRQLARKVEEKNTSNLSDIVFFYHSTYVSPGVYYIQHNFRSTFFTIRRYVPFDVYYVQHYFQSTFFTSWHFVPFDVYYLHSYVLPSLFTIRRFVLSTFFTIQCLFCRPFIPFDVLSVDVFYAWRFLLDILSVNLRIRGLRYTDKHVTITAQQYPLAKLQAWPEPEFLNIYWRLKSRLFATSCLFKGQRVQQGSYRLQVC